MRPSSIKNPNHAFSTHYNHFTLQPNIQSPESYDFSKPSNNSNIFNTKNTYQSNCNYFSNRMTFHIANQSENNQKFSHQRFKSLGNSRTTIRSGTSSQQNIQHYQSSPYFLHIIPNENKIGKTTPKCTQRNVQQKIMGNINSQNSLNRPMKLSMKSSHKNNEKSSFLKDSQVSTINQTNNTNNSKLMQQKIKKEQLVKYLSCNFQHGFNTLRNQIRQQSTLIQTLQHKINKLNINLVEKQKIISNLINSISQNKSNPQSLSSPNSQITNVISTKIKNLELMNESLKHKFNEQAAIQIKINQEIDKLMAYFEKMQKNKPSNTNLSQQFQSRLQVLKKVESHCINSKRILQQTSQIKKIAQVIQEKCRGIKKILNKTQTSSLSVSNAMQQTAQFNNDHINDPSSSKLKYGGGNQSLNDSASYFFHPSQLNNIQKITELFINRHGQPIKCYIDNKNQLRYIDTNTFMFNKKGDIVQLNQSEKRYYMDKGFIVQNK